MSLRGDREPQGCFDQAIEWLSWGLLVAEVAVPGLTSLFIQLDGTYIAGKKIVFDSEATNATKNAIYSIDIVRAGDMAAAIFSYEGEYFWHGLTANLLLGFVNSGLIHKSLKRES